MQAAEMAKMRNADPKKAVLQHILVGTALTIGAPIALPVVIAKGTYQKMKKKSVNPYAPNYHQQTQTASVSQAQDQQIQQAQDILITRGLSDTAALGIAKYYLDGDPWPKLSGEDDMTWLAIMNEIEGDYEQVGLA